MASKKPVVHVPHFHDESLLDSDTCMSKSPDIDSPPSNLLLGEVYKPKSVLGSILHAQHPHFRERRACTYEKSAKILTSSV